MNGEPVWGCKGCEYEEYCKFDGRYKEPDGSSGPNVACAIRAILLRVEEAWKKQDWLELTKCSYIDKDLTYGYETFKKAKSKDPKEVKNDNGVKQVEEGDKGTKT